MISKQLFKIALALIISLFLFQSATAQSLTSPRNNCFTDVERDSILSKLLAKEYFEQQFTLSQQALKEADIIIVTLKEKDSLNQSVLAQEKEQFAKEAALKKKQARKGKITAAGIGFLAGAFLVALIL